MKIAYEDAIKLIEHGDVLLFQGSGTISWLIKTYNYGEYSHAAIIDNSDSIPMCCEMKEFKGGRCVSLKSQVDKVGTEIKKIDVFRPLYKISYEAVEYNNGEYKTVKKTKTMTNDVKDNIVRRMLEITGSDYGWKSIWKIAKHYLPFLRLVKPKTKDVTESELHICSSAVSFCLRTEFEDPVPYLPDYMVTPSDLSRSPLLKYMFTIEK